MHLSTRLDCDLVAVEQSDELTLLVEITAPAAEPLEARAPATLQVVLDRSGSMEGDRLNGAKAALLALVDRLDPGDNLGVVAFDTHVQVVVPAGPLADKTAVKAAIAGIDSGGSTDLSAGYLRGLQEARRVAGPAGGTVLLVSDGHANAGVTDPEVLGKVALEAQTSRITTSTLGFGLGYDERILHALAESGAGNELFAEEADTAVAQISGEVDGLLAQVAQAASLRVRWGTHVLGASVLNELPVSVLPDGLVLELGSFYAGETRRLVLTLKIPGIAALGLTEVASLEFAHVSLPDLVQHTTSVPLQVNVVPGDQAAGRVRDPQVHSEALFQQTQQVKRRSSGMLSRGRSDDAARLLTETSIRLGVEAAMMPAEFGKELAAEAELMAALAEEARVDSARAARVSSSDAARKGRTRGRASRGGGLTLRWAEGRVRPESTLEVEEWQLVRLLRGLPSELHPVFSAGQVADRHTAGTVAAALGEGHPLQSFFAGAAQHGGFSTDRN